MREGGRVFQYGKCAACDVVFADPQPTADEIDWLYRNRYDYAWFIRRRGLKRLQAWHRWRRLRSILAELGATNAARRMLDVGGGHAWFLRAAKNEGWQAEGLELLDDELLAAARAHGITMHHGSLLAHPLERQQYDLLTAWHVIEHIPGPRAALQTIANLLSPGGLCVIAVPNLHATGFERAGAAWAWCQKPFIHPWHFSATALEKLLPSELEPLLVTTRDTWDAQWFETTTAYDAAMTVLYYACRAPRKAALMLGLRRLGAACETVQFWAEEALRLTTYATYLALRPALSRSYEQALRGSELLLVARKKPAGV